MHQVRSTYIEQYYVLYTLHGSTDLIDLYCSIIRQSSTFALDASQITNHESIKDSTPTTFLIQPSWTNSTKKETLVVPRSWTRETPVVRTLRFVPNYPGELEQENCGRSLLQSRSDSWLFWPVLKLPLPPSLPLRHMYSHINHAARYSIWY